MPCLWLPTHAAPFATGLLLACAGLRWAMPRMQHPQSLRAHFDAADALEFISVREGAPDLSSLVQLQLQYVEADEALGAMALEGMLRQARRPPAAVAPSQMPQT